MAVIHKVPRSWYRSTRSVHEGPTREVLIGQGVEYLIDHGTLLDRAPAHRPLADVAAFLQDAYRRRTARERDGEDAREVQRFEPVSRQVSYGGGGDPSPPKRFSEPVTDLRRTALDITSQLEPDAARGLAMHFYREVRLRVLT
jgi:hypothetical protein